MDGWMDGWMGGWMDGWMDGWVEGGEGWMMGEGIVPLRNGFPSHIIPPSHAPNLSAWQRISDHQLGKAPVFYWTAVIQETEIVSGERT